MKAMVYRKYGPPEVLQLMEVAKPRPQPNQVLVKVHAASVDARDWRLFTLPPVLARFLGRRLLSKDSVLGVDIAGRVEEVGATVTRFQPGDEVFGISRGAFAEYAVAHENKLAIKPPNVSFEVAAAVPVAAVTALQAVRNGRIQPGQRVLINGASGGVGTFAVQIAKAFGADVTAVCSTRNLRMARSIGADQVIDYTREDFTKNKQHYSLIIAVNGYYPILNYRRSLVRGGTYVAVGGSMEQVFEAMLLGPLAHIIMIIDGLSTAGRSGHAAALLQAAVLYWVKPGKVIRQSPNSTLL